MYQSNHSNQTPKTRALVGVVGVVENNNINKELKMKYKMILLEKENSNIGVER